MFDAVKLLTWCFKNKKKKKCDKKLILKPIQIIRILCICRGIRKVFTIVFHHENKFTI